MKIKLTTLIAIFFIATIFAQKSTETNQKIIQFNNQVFSTAVALNSFSQEYKLNKGNTFLKVYQNTDKTGMIHEKFQQYLNGIKVEFGTAITHTLKGRITMVNGELYGNSKEETVPTITKENAFTKAVNAVGATSYLWQDSTQSKLMDYSKPTGELVYFPSILNKTLVLAYKFDIYATAPISRQIVYVDANNGNVLFLNPIIKHADKLINTNVLKNSHKKIEEAINATLIAGSADTKYSGTRPIETTFNGTTHLLNDTSRGNGIFTYNCQKTTTYQNTDFTDVDNNWTSAEFNNAAKDNGALDAHWGAEKTYDFWNTVFGRNSFDNNGAAIRSYVHYDVAYDNAFWNGSVMTYGDGSSFNILTSIDVCGHEIGHAICSYTADLVYANESGAMNEGYSDIWGACIEHFGRTGSLTGTLSNSVWLIGEDISASSLRSMSNPLSRNDPDTYLGTQYYIGTADSGGVHTNSGVLNHWFYILTQGKTGTNNAPTPDTYSVTGIGLVKASEIAYLAERDYLTPNSTFADARNATIQVASSIYCGNSPEVEAVTNAWYAVNVGEAYVAANDDVALQSIEESTLVNCNATSVVTDLIIKNQGINTISNINISYRIDGGTPVNTSVNATILSCEEITLPLVINGLTRGSHTVSVTSTITNDGRSENNTKSTVLLINDNGTVGVSNPFTNPTDALITYNEDYVPSTWVKGIRTSGLLSSSGNTVYTSNLSGNYPDNVKSYLVSQCYNLNNVVNPSISFSMKYDLELNWDVVYVEYSTNFGSTWSVLGTTGATWYNSNRTPATSGSDCNNCPGAQWTGTNTTLTTYTYPLNTLNSETNIIFRIVFHSDEAENKRGVNIDDFVINGTLSNQNFELQNITLYPNPSKGIFNISLGAIEPTNIDVFDISGKIIWSKKDFTIANAEVVLDLATVAQGIYFVKITAENQSTVKRIIKE